MANTLTSKLLVDGAKHYTLAIHNVSDGTQETLAKKVDVTTMVGYNAVTNPLNKIKLRSIKYATTGNMTVLLYWEGTPNTLLWSIPPNYTDEIEFDYTGFLQNEATSPTGNILLSTLNAAANSTYSIIFDILKT